ncbi:MAG: methylenetetrahydrofolate--tRNA-(uracil(54)-C(5))-methyltransferase (FADH(2)-oxidizing) TrmFO [Deltaproteobacteria bacterium]|nr:methylenetetrahydrofolate--tRNA-(uracil(54)-C(5))-methyltransferase (FADH(2)-oxidizing) TrmFO [Deltaproteobacteria bacterium]
MPIITIIGGGLAGSEAAYQIAKRGAKVRLFEMKPKRFSPAHRLSGLAELVCSNSLKSTELTSAHGLLKEEMRLLGSLIINAAHETNVPAGSALAVDRERFSGFITDTLLGLGVEIIREEALEIPLERPLIIATGPLTSDGFAEALGRFIGKPYLYFHDAVSPVIYADSIDMDIAFIASRYGKGADYINCPMTKEKYLAFREELVRSEKTAFKDFEGPRWFEGCLPIEVIAERGMDTLAFGPLKPVGLIEPATGKTTHAVVQLRKENRTATLYNMVGFQTRLAYGEQKRIFRTIPGLEKAEFARFGKIHRNMFIESPRIIERTLAVKSDPLVFFAGQITGVEGYSEAGATGLIAGINALRCIHGKKPAAPLPTTMTGALLEYISGYEGECFQPMNANLGLLTPIHARRKDRKRLYAERALKAMEGFVLEVS